MAMKWKIYNADLNPVTGSEQKGTRPVLIVSDEDYSTVMPLVTVLPVTSLKSGRRVYPNEVLIKGESHNKTGLLCDSIVLAHQIRTISKSRLKDLLGSIDELELQEKINYALRIHLNL